jgi:hypothetical protein
MNDSGDAMTEQDDLARIARAVIDANSYMTIATEDRAGCRSSHLQRLVDRQERPGHRENIGPVAAGLILG